MNDNDKINEIFNLVRRLNFDEFKEQLTLGNSLDELLIELKHYEQKANDQKNRIHKIINHISNCFAGDFFNQLPVSEKEDELDVVCMGFNTYIEELKGVMVSRDALEKVNIELLKEKEISDKLSIAKDEFMSNISHEIRTPLNGIIGFSKILETSNLTDSQLNLLKNITVSSEILMALINNILELNILNSKNEIKFEKNKININELIPYYVSTFHEIAFEKRIKINIQLDTKISKSLIGDSSKLAQIFIHVIGNAVRFTNNDGVININGKVIDDNISSMTIEFQIENNSVGITTDKIKTIFNSNHQTNHTEYVNNDLGLRLTISKKIIELLNGTLSIESELNKGTKTLIQIPFQKDIITKENTILGIEENMANYKAIHILVAEDNAINQLLMKTILQKEGFDVDIADNGKIATKMIENKDYDIILMDLMMPEMNGYEASETIRKMEDTSKSTIPIIAVSADVTKDIKEKCKAAGMNNYISKPYDAKELVEKIISSTK